MTDLVKCLRPTGQQLLTNLGYVQGDQFDSKSQARGVTKRRREWSDINIDRSIQGVWFEVVNLAQLYGTVDELFAIAVRRARSRRACARRSRERLKGSFPRSTSATQSGGSPPMVRNSNRSWGLQCSVLPISILESGLKCTRSVVRLS